jgi:hypothetical protein
MSDAGGQITHLGVLYQDKIAALYLGRMLDPRAPRLPLDQQVVEVRGEKPGAEVDDVVVRFADGHAIYIQAKTALQDSGNTWQKLWEHFYKQQQRPDFDRSRDRIVLLMGDYADWFRVLKSTCRKAASSQNAQEWLDRLVSQDQIQRKNKLLDLIDQRLRAEYQKLLAGGGFQPGAEPPAPAPFAVEDLYRLLGLIDVEFVENETIEEERLIYWLPDSNRNLAALFDQLCILVTRYSSEGRLFDPALLLRELDRLEIVIKPLEQQRAMPETAETQVIKAIGGFQQDFLPRARKQAEGFLREHTGQAEYTGTFIPAIYVHRQQVEDHLEKFLAGQAPLLVLTGDSGVGKTNLLCQWTQELLDADQSVFVYNCGFLQNIEIENTIAQDLSIPGGGHLLPALGHISQQASALGKQFVIIFDNLYGYRGADKTEPYHLFRHIDELVRNPDFPEQSIKILISCSTATFKSLERQDPQALERVYRPPYYQPAKEQVLCLGMFTDEELKAAYAVYQRYFQLQMAYEELPEFLCQRLRTPVLLRMFAETYQGKLEPIAYEAQALGIFRNYYDDHVRRVEDRNLVRNLVSEMYNRKRVSLSLDRLVEQEKFQSVILDLNPDSSFRRMLELGILTVTAVPLLGEELRFTHARFGAFALAVYMWQEHEGAVDEAVLKELTGDGAFSSMSWDAAITLLLLSKESQLFLSCASSQSVELRELVIQALVELYADEPGLSVNLIKELINSDSPDAYRNGLKAAYWIGPGARDVFLWAATRGSAELRRVTKDILYLIWRHDPDFTYGLLNELADRFNLLELSRLRSTLEFLIELSITIYINHPENKDVISQTTELWYKILIDRLHLNLLKTDLFGKEIENLLFRIVGSGFTGLLMDTALFTEFVPADRFFNLPDSERERFKQLVAMVDPQVDIHARADDLKALFESDLILFNILACVVLAAHAYAKFSEYQGLLEDLWQRMSPQGKVWELISFAVLLPDAPDEWVPLLEIFTRQMVEEYPGFFFGDEMPLIQKFDLLMIPLGISYGKRGSEAPYFVELLDSAFSQADRRLLRRSLAGLGLVGFYYPQAVFQTLRSSVPNFKDARLQDDLVLPLATMRTLHLDEVDNFLNQIGASEAFQRRVSAATDIELVKRYIYSLGIYNNAVHQAINYPIMRRELLIGGLTALADSRRPQDFVGKYTVVPIRMLRAADYRLDRWTLPE